MHDKPTALPSTTETITRLIENDVDWSSIEKMSEEQLIAELSETADQMRIEAARYAENPGTFWREKISTGIQVVQRGMQQFIQINRQAMRQLQAEFRPQELFDHTDPAQLQQAREETVEGLPLVLFEPLANGDELALSVVWLNDEMPKAAPAIIFKAEGHTEPLAAQWDDWADEEPDQVIRVEGLRVTDQALVAWQQRPVLEYTWDADKAVLTIHWLVVEVIS